MEHNISRRSGQQAWQFLQDYGPAALILDALDAGTETVAAELAKGGFDLVLVAHNTHPLESLAARLRDHEGVSVTLCRWEPGNSNSATVLAAQCADHNIGAVCAVHAKDHTDLVQLALQKKGQRSRWLPAAEVIGY